MNLIGEGAVVSARVSRVAKALHERRVGAIAKDVGELSDAADLSERISEELQTVLLGMRLVPIRTVFQKFPRVVRDVSRAGGKEVELVTRGGETPVDKAVLDRLGDPLMHAVRNAADHGIEPPDERRARGKDPCGTVTLRARQEGDHIVIEVMDDGRGMDAQRIREKAVEKGVITAEEAGTLEEEEALRLVLRPGFSTVEQVTDISGRGVGMDVVATTVRELGGRVDIASRPGEGSTVRLTIPVKKLMMDLLLVEAGGQRFGVPLELVIETTRVASESVRVVDGGEATFLRGELLGLARLGDVMQLRGEAEAQRRGLPVVVLAVEGRRLGLVVDRIEDHQEVMLKPLEWEFGELRGVAGSAILGDGEVVTVLEPSEIAALARESRAGRAA
jgi:two-component system chemotaxis sensor kinase CheA